MFFTETKPFGVIVGLLGNLMIAIAIHQLVGLDVNDIDLSGVWLLPLGITISTVATFLGGGSLVFATSFLAVGLGALTTGESFGLLFGGIFTLAALFTGAMGFAMSDFSSKKKQQAQDLVATGARGTGTVVSITDTGMTINDNPRVQLVMRIQPEDGSPAWDATKAVTVSRIAIPRVGDRFPVWYDRANPTQWAYGVPTASPVPL